MLDLRSLQSSKRHKTAGKSATDLPRSISRHSARVRGRHNQSARRSRLGRSLSSLLDRGRVRHGSGDNHILEDDLRRLEHGRLLGDVVLVVTLDLIALDAGDVCAVEVAVDCGDTGLVSAVGVEGKGEDVMLPSSVAHGVLGHSRALGKRDVGRNVAAGRCGRACYHIDCLIEGRIL